MHTLAFCLLIALPLALGEDTKSVALPSGITVVPVDEDSRYPDEEKTSSHLFKVGQGGVTDSHRLTLNIMVSNFRDASVPFFRAHPVFLECLQKVWSAFDDPSLEIKFKQGFLASGGSSVKERYRKSGTGAVIGLQKATSAKPVVSAFLRHCPPLFAPLGRDLGVIVEPNDVFVYMTGEKTPSTQSLSVAGSSQFSGVDINAWAREQVDKFTDPPVVPKCGADVKALAANAVYPSGASADPAATVGPVDRPVRRTSADPGRQDLLRLIQYPSDNLAFAVPAPTPNCPAAGGIHGNAPTTRCGPRQMAPRLFVKMNLLQKMARSQLSSKLRVDGGWLDGGKADGVRQEARQLSVRLVSSSTAARLGDLSRLAVCAGFDFVRHSGDHLVLAVAKQLKVDTKPIAFPNLDLIPAAAPAEDWKTLYALEDGFDPNDYPLFDRLFKATQELSTDAPASLFHSRESDVRYFRISNSIVKCYTEVVRLENRGRSSKSPVQVTVVTAYMSNNEESSRFNPVYDRRLNTHTLGIGIHLAYKDPQPGYDQWRLARTVATVCPAVFQTKEEATSTGRSAAIGIYTDGVFVGMADAISAWLECVDCSRLKPPGDAEDFIKSLKTRMKDSQANRVIDPNSWSVACQFDSPPKVPDPKFVYRHPEAVKRVRRSATPTEDCRLSAPASSFCQKGLRQRQDEVNKIWAIITRKHLLVDKAKVKAALDGCLLSCSKCTSGPLWDSKVENCENFIHWIPFEFLNDRSGVVTHLFSRVDEKARQHACETGGHCIDLSPIFGILYPTLESRFHPDPNKANQELVYDSVENSSPLLGQLARLYSLMARGEVVIWARSENDIAGMEDALKVVFVYNRHVTRVRVYVLDTSAQGTIISALESRLEAWRTSTCPTHTRETLTPYTVDKAPALPASKEFDIRRQLRADDRKLNEEGYRRDFI